ncbi:GntR family transcriptional regulator [Pseudochelatococcus sp. B33]
MTASQPNPQTALTERIFDLIHKEGLVPGDRINEHQLARRLNVSRSPVRAALNALAEQGVVVRLPQKGVQLVELPPRLEIDDGGEGREELLVRIARDRDHGALGDDFSESELMQRYAVPRAMVRDALQSLADLGMVQRKLGYGWRFVTNWGAEVRAESYRFRIVMEPAAILETGFRLPDGWADDMRRRHREISEASWTPALGVALFEVNAAFHEGIAAASGNRFFHEAIRRQNRLRRFSNYNWTHGLERVRANHREHLEILDHLEAGENFAAAGLMHQHLLTASRMTPSFENK